MEPNRATLDGHMELGDWSLNFKRLSVAIRRPLSGQAFYLVLLASDVYRTHCNTFRTLTFRTHTIWTHTFFGTLRVVGHINENRIRAVSYGYRKDANNANDANDSNSWRYPAFIGRCWKREETPRLTGQRVMTLKRRPKVRQMSFAAQNERQMRLEMRQLKRIHHRF